MPKPLTNRFPVLYNTHCCLPVHEFRCMAHIATNSVTAYLKDQPPSGSLLSSTQSNISSVHPTVLFLSVLPYLSPIEYRKRLVQIVTTSVPCKLHSQCCRWAQALQALTKQIPPTVVYMYYCRDDDGKRIIFN